MFLNGITFFLLIFVEGTYFAFYKSTGYTFDNNTKAICLRKLSKADDCSDIPGCDINGMSFCYRGPDQLTDYDKIPIIPNLPNVVSFEEYRQALNGTFHSDPVIILKDHFCYRWAFRLINQNEGESIV